MTDWQQHFAAVRGEARLDADNDTFWHAQQALALQYGGPLVGKWVLDMACGTGALCRAALGLGAEKVTGTEMPDAIERLRLDHRGVEYLPFDLNDPESWPAAHDVVFCVESLYYVADPVAVLWNLWERCVGGRLVAIVGNAQSLLVEKARLDYGGNYRGVHPGALDALGKNLPACSKFEVLGVHIDAEQRIVPFNVRPIDGRGQPPHRLLFVGVR